MCIHHFIVIGARGPDDRALQGTEADVAAWLDLAPVLAGPDARTTSISGDDATAVHIETTVAETLAQVSDGDQVSFVVLGHGTPGPKGRRSFLSNDRLTVVLDEFTQTLSNDVAVSWYLELCGEAGPRRLVSSLPAHHVVHSACRLDELAEQRKFDGQWRGAWSYAVARVLEQATGEDADGRAVVELDHATLAHRAGLMLQALGVAQTPMVDGPEARLMEQVDGSQRAVEVESPRMAMEMGAGKEGIILDGGDAWISLQVDSGGSFTSKFRTGETVGNMPSNLVLKWRAPTTGELNQLGGPTITDTSSTFTNVGSVTAGGGRMYKSSRRMFVLAVKGGFTKLTWWTESNELDSNDYIKTGADDSLSHITTAPGAPPGGWEKAVDD